MAHKKQRGLALPITLFFILILSGMAAILTQIARENQSRIRTERDSESVYYASEGMLNKLISDMTIYGALWDQLAPLGTKPSGYTEYAPATYSSTNGIPTCTGIACHRNYFPTGGGLIKNVGPLETDGKTVSSSSTISKQLNYASPPAADLTLGNLSAWVQVERLDETTPSASTVGGSLSSGISEGGNAKEVRFRVTAYSSKKLRTRTGVSCTVSVVQVPMT